MTGIVFVVYTTQVVRMEISTDELAVIIGNECLAGKVRRLSRVVTSIYDRALQPYGIKINQASILVFLSIVGEASPGEIGKRLQMEKSTVSRNIERMRISGWLEVVGKGTGATQTLKITPLGQQLLTESHSQWENAQKKTRELIGEDGAQALRMLSERVRQDV